MVSSANVLTWVGPFEGFGAFPTINRQWTAAIERQGWYVRRNVHVSPLIDSSPLEPSVLPPVCVVFEYPLRTPNVHHDLNIGIAVWEFEGEQGVPRSFAEQFNKFDIVASPAGWSTAQFKRVTTTPCYTIRFGFDPDEFRPGGTRCKWAELFPGEAWMHSAEHIALWVGGTDQRHGFDLALDTLDLLPDGWHLVAKQSKDYPEDAREHPRLHRLRATLPSLAPLYRAADVYLHSARGVGFSLPCLDAIACGVPVAAVWLPPLVAYANDRIIFADAAPEYAGPHHVHSDCVPYWYTTTPEKLATAVLQARALPRWTALPESFVREWSWDAAAVRLLSVIREVQAAHD